MLDWLKDILGEVYTDEIDDKISKEIGKGFVSKADFNAKVKKIGENEKTIAEQTTELDNLRKSNVDAAAVQKQIDDLNAQHATEINQLKLGFAVEMALKDAGAKNPATVKPLLESFIKDAKFDENGGVEGLTEKIRQLSEDESTAFLFDTPEKAKLDVAGAAPGDPGNKGANTAKSIDDMSYSELSAYLAENPNALN
jgi:hypothetical protein